MIKYYYKELQPDLYILESNIIISIFHDKYEFCRWDEEDRYLKIFLVEALNETEETILNNIVNPI